MNNNYEEQIDNAYKQLIRDKVLFDFRYALKLNEEKETIDLYTTNNAQAPDLDKCICQKWGHAKYRPETKSAIVDEFNYNEFKKAYKYLLELRPEQKPDVVGGLI